MKIAVIGGGVSGLTTATVLQEAGHETVILTREPYTKTTSWAAAAIFSPYLVEEGPRARRWMARACEVFKELSADPESGVVWIGWNKYSHSGPLKPAEKIPGIDSRNFAPEELPVDRAGGLAVRVPLAIPDFYLPYLTKRYERAGGAVHLETVESFDDVLGDYDAAVNCTGVHAGALTGDDTLYPGRGQVFVVRNPGLAEGRSEQDLPTYIYPRGKDCIVGGCYNEGNWSMEPDESMGNEIWRNAVACEPRLKDAEILETRVGLRPMRPTVRLEAERRGDKVVVHNYGHGGAGYTLSWGCAEQARDLLKGAG